jgi:hypothetical protein
MNKWFYKYNYSVHFSGLGVGIAEKLTLFLGCIKFYFIEAGHAL